MAAGEEVAPQYGPPVTDPALLAQLNATQYGPAVSDPQLLAQLNGKSATAADRVQAAEGGILKGAGYLLTSLPDAAANVWNLGKAAAALPWIVRGKTPPSALEPGDAFPVGKALTGLMDKSDITTTQPTRPDDTASRYLNTAASVLPGVLSGGGSLPTMARNVAASAVPAMVGQTVAEHPLTHDEATNNALTIAAQVLAGQGMPRGRSLMPQNEKLNDAVISGQKIGLVFPPATTNPSSGNRMVETVAGKLNTQQHASLINQQGTNAATRQAIGLPAGNGPIQDYEFAIAKKLAAPGYDAVRSAGQLQVPADFGAKLNDAIGQNSKAAEIVPALGDKKIKTIVNQLQNNRTMDAAGALAVNQKLRDLASSAFRNGESETGKAYKSVSKVIEDAIDSGLTAKGEDGAQMLADYKASRVRFAQIADAEEAWNKATGNVRAQKLASALNGGAKMTGPLATIANAAAQAPKAFAEPTNSAGVHHLGFWGSVAGGLGGLSHFMPEDGHMGTAAAATAMGAAAVPFARFGARKYALGLGQRNVLPTKPSAYTLGQILGSYGGGVPSIASGQTP